VVTDDVVMVKVRLVAPAGTVTLAGTDAALELSESDTVAPPLGAALLKVTVPVDELPPATVGGLTLTAESVGGGGVPGGFTVSCTERVTPLPLAEMVTTVVVETARGVKEKKPLSLIALMNTRDGRNPTTAGLSLVRLSDWS
jgi:hypothetical protein